MEENIYSTPQANLVVEPKDASGALFFPTSLKKLVILHVLTLGIYPVYWFYKNWRVHQKYMQKKTIPILRALFYIFFTHSLFKKIADTAKDRNVEMPWSPGTLATVLVLSTIIANVAERIASRMETTNALDYFGPALIFVKLIPLYLIQDLVNKVNADPRGELNRSFSIYNWIFIVLGAILWLLIFIGLFLG